MNRVALMLILRQLPNGHLAAMLDGLNRSAAGHSHLTDNDREIACEVIEQITVDRSMIEAANRKSGGKT